METRDAPKLRRVRRLDSIRLDKNDSTYFTNEGYLVDHPILTSCGIFEYTNPDGSIRRELRLPKYVFDENSLKTYRGKPIIITHDAGVVDKNNVDKEQIGTILSDGYEDGEDVRAEIIIHDTDSMQKCGLKELSLGYNLDLVEDNELNAEIAEFMLTENGAKVETVKNGLEAVQHFEASEPGTYDVILMDVMMPVMDGLTATRTIRILERQDAKTIPIIAMTANAFREDAEKCLEAGMNAHLAKPLDDEKIKQTIREELRKQNACHE